MDKHRVTFCLWGEGAPEPEIDSERGETGQRHEWAPLASRLFPSGQSLFENARQAGVDVETICGGFGRCSKCRVWIASGEVTPITDAERRYLSQRELARGFRLSCQVLPVGDVVALVPEISNKVQAKVKLALGKKLDWDDPYVLKRAISPDIDGPITDERIRHRIVDELSLVEKVCSVAPSCYEGLPPRPLSKEGVLTGVISSGRLMALEKGNTTGYNYGVAIDIGSTTIVAYLVDLNSATVLDAAACTNGQAAWGGDVMSRINHALTNATGLDELHGKVIGDVNGLISELCEKDNISKDNIYRIVVVGNTAMHHLFFGLDVATLGLAPYEPRSRDGIELPARNLGIEVNREATAYFLPLIGGFVGADTTGVILSTGIWKAKKLSLAIDIGTNGEMVLGDKGGLLCCSNAAGPAFEGGEITFGMRAVAGAIERIRLKRNGDVRAKVIGNIPARGICGSGVIDLMALLLETGIVEPSGRMLPPERLPEKVPGPLRRRIAQGEGGVRFALVEEEESARREPIYFTAGDVRQVQLASGAIAAARRILLKEMGREVSDIEQVLIAGAFGNHITPRSAVRMGLIPDLSPERLRFVGNAAGDGAKMALASRKHLERADRIHGVAGHVELAGRQDYMDLFMEAMAFPTYP
ncbi:MAG: ASKHA domain-containing protein [Dehalococcoidia bacterium]